MKEPEPGEFRPYMGWFVVALVAFITMACLISSLYFTAAGVSAAVGLCALVIGYLAKIAYLAK